MINPTKVESEPIVDKVVSEPQVKPKRGTI